jgi:predicted O-methyltransferase YrrM
MLQAAKSRLAGFLRWHITAPVVAMQRELSYQNLFDIQCRNRGITNDFYAVGAAASYGLMYLLFRVFNEHEIKSVVEFGSGQTTLLIDRIKRAGTHHACYEHSPEWHALIARRLTSCEYRLRPLEEATIDGRPVQWYAGVEMHNFDLLLIDGPPGADRYSRFGCVELIRTRTSPDFLIIMDDVQRQGEQDTVAHIVELLRSAGLAFRVNQLQARTTQTVIAGGRFVAATYYY